MIGRYRKTSEVLDETSYKTSEVYVHTNTKFLDMFILLLKLIYCPCVPRGMQCEDIV